MNALLNIFGIGFVAYAVILLMRSSKTDEEVQYGEFFDKKESEEFNSEEFMDELNSFSKILDEKKNDESMKENNNIARNTNQDIYTPSAKIEREFDKSEDPGYSSLVKDVSKNKSKKNIGASNSEILSLKDIGLSNKEIAKRTNRSVREIEVILKIYKNK